MLFHLNAILLPEYICVGTLWRIFGLTGACISNICINWQLIFSRHINALIQGVCFAGLNWPYFTYVLFFLCPGVLSASYGINGWRRNQSRPTP